MRFLAFALVSLLAFQGCVQQNPERADLVVYTYDSMVSEYGLGPKVVPKFEEKCNCTVQLVSKGDAGQVVTALQLERDNPKADLVIGIDNTLYARALEADVLEEFTPSNIGIVPDRLRFSGDYLTSYDYGYIAFVYDSEALGFTPASFDDMLDSRLRDKVLIQNPRTSSPTS